MDGVMEVLSGRERRRRAPLVEELESWMRQERAKFSRHNEVAQAIDYILNRCKRPVSLPS